MQNAKMHWHNFLTRRARTLLYKGYNTPNGDTNTDNTIIDYDNKAIPFDLSMVICC